jgi:hypothetical protein
MLNIFPHVYKQTNMALNLEIIVGTYEEFLLGYRIRPSRSVSRSMLIKFKIKLTQYL